MWIMKSKMLYVCEGKCSQRSTLQCMKHVWPVIAIQNPNWTCYLHGLSLKNILVRCDVHVNLPIKIYSYEIKH